MPFFEDYAPTAHGTPDPRIVVRRALADDIPAMATVARSRGPQPASFDERLAQWVADEERRVCVAVPDGGGDVDDGVLRAGRPDALRAAERPVIAGARGGEARVGEGPDVIRVAEPSVVATTRGGEAGVGEEARVVRVAERPVVAAARDGKAGTGEAADGVRDTVVGWAMVARWAGHDDAPDGWYVSWLVVDPAWRRRGIAARLLDDLLSWTSGRATRVFSLVNATNRASLDLHARRGFQEVARAGQFAGVTFTGGVGLLLEARTR